MFGLSEHRFGVKVGQVYPAGIATPWWDDASRGGTRGNRPDVTKFLSPDDVAQAIMTFVDQGPLSDIEKIVLRPTAKL